MDLKGANPQGADNEAPKKKKLDRSKYLTNNLPRAVQMQSMQDLDRKRRHSAMMTKSNVFNQGANPEQFLGSSKNKTTRPKNNMDVILAYDLGHETKVGYDDKSDVSS